MCFGILWGNVEWVAIDDVADLALKVPVVPRSDQPATATRAPDRDAVLEHCEFRRHDRAALLPGWRMLGWRMLWGWRGGQAAQYFAAGRLFGGLGFCFCLAARARGLAARGRFFKCLFLAAGICAATRAEPPEPYVPSCSAS